MEFLRMPMGINNEPQAFTRLMELALAGLQWTTCVIYLDDVIVFGKTIEEHLIRLDGSSGTIQDQWFETKTNEMPVLSGESTVPGACGVQGRCSATARKHRESEKLANAKGCY